MTNVIELKTKPKLKYIDVWSCAGCDKFLFYISKDSEIWCATCKKKIKGSTVYISNTAVE